MIISQQEAILLCQLLATVGLTISTLELISTKAFSSTKLLSTIVYKSWLFKIVSRLHKTDKERYTYLNFLLWIRLSLTISLLPAIFSFHELIPYFLFLIVVTNLLISISKQIGNDGADQMNNIIFISLLFYFTSSNQTIHFVSILFIVSQSLLSYFTAGFVKLTSAIWTKSNAIGNILGSLSYGQPTAFKFLSKNKTVGVWLSRFIVIFELLLPFCLILPPDYCLVALIVAAIFHFNCGIWMGLNDFIWAFTSTYPLIFWTCLQIHSA